MKLKSFIKSPYDKNEITAIYDEVSEPSDIEIGDIYDIEGNKYRVSKIKKICNLYHLTLKKNIIECGDYYG